MSRETMAMPESDARDMDLSPSIRGDISETQAGALSAVARAEAEIKAAIVVAKRFPRDEQAAHLKIMKSCDRVSFAEEAMYAFPRGAETVEGPSVSMARELARCWGNIRFGLRIVTEDDERLHITGYSYDAETNTLVEMEDKFAKLIFRKRSGWVKPDERDLRELMNRRGAICVRNAILQLIPRDIVEDAVARCKETMVKAAKGQMKQDPKAVIRTMVEKFDGLSVTIAMLEKKLGHAIDITTAEEIAELRGIWKSISDGNTKRNEHFEVAEARPTATVDLDAVKASAASAAPRASTADSLKPTQQAPQAAPPPSSTARLVEKRIKVTETGTKPAETKGLKKFVITAEWDGGKGVLTSMQAEHAKLAQEAMDTGMLLDALWEETGEIRMLAKLTRTDEPKDESFRSSPQPTSAAGPINVG